MRLHTSYHLCYVGLFMLQQAQQNSSREHSGTAAGFVTAYGRPACLHPAALHFFCVGLVHTAASTAEQQQNRLRAHSLSDSM
jgi:hypothetical protein